MLCPTELNFPSGVSILLVFFYFINIYNGSETRRLNTIVILIIRVQFLDILLTYIIFSCTNPFKFNAIQNGALKLPEVQLCALEMLVSARPYNCLLTD